MPKENLHLLTEKQKIEYLDTFWGGYETLLIKKRLAKRHRNTDFVIKDSKHTSREEAIKKLVTLTHEKRSLTFSIEIKPWSWSTGEVQVQIEFVDGKNLLVPTSKIDKSALKTFRPQYDPMLFISRTEQVGYYLNLVEMTALDVSLIDNFTAHLENLLK